MIVDAFVMTNVDSEGDCHARVTLEQRPVDAETGALRHREITVLLPPFDSRDRVGGHQRLGGSRHIRIRGGAVGEQVQFRNQRWRRHRKLTGRLVVAELRWPGNRTRLERLWSAQGHSVEAIVERDEGLINEGSWTARARGFIRLRRESILESHGVFELPEIIVLKRRV